MLEMSVQEKMALIAVVSKALEFREEWGGGLVLHNRLVENTQIQSALDTALPIMARLDRDNPGALPLPHNGVPWGERG